MSLLWRVSVLSVALVLAGPSCSDKSQGPPGSAATHGNGDRKLSGQVAVLKTRYSRIIVWDDGPYRCLAFGKRTAIQSCVHRTNHFDFRYEYVDMMFAAVALVDRPVKVLTLGLGAGALPTLLGRSHPQTTQEVVEIDRGVLTVAEKHLYFKVGPQFNVHIEDAFRFVTRAADAGKPPTYDLIWLDCYDAKHIPKHLLTDRFVTALRRILKPGGVLAANFWPSHPSYPTSVKQYKRLFTEVWRITPARSSNHVLIALRQPLKLSAAQRKTRAIRLDKRLPRPLGLAATVGRMKRLR